MQNGDLTIQSYDSCINIQLSTYHSGIDVCQTVFRMNKDQRIVVLNQD
jgi:hypothetical protein